MSTKQILITITLAVVAHITAQYLYDKYFAKKAVSNG